MIQALLQAPGYHLIFEAALIIWIFRLLFTKSYKTERTVLTKQEKETLINDWQPEPLVPDVAEDDYLLQQMKHKLVEGKIGKHVTINGIECLNFASLNFLGMVGKSNVEEASLNALKKYGVGSCGPRGFYGTVDVHLELEEKLAEFMNCEEAIIYSYGFATVASAIPAYSKRGDVIFCDEGVCFAIQKGILASRSNVKYFKHNDMEDLERLLQEQAKEDKKHPKRAKVTRRFLVVEGLYMNYGDLCPLEKLVELKWKYKVRIFMDETISFGTLGRTGKGVTEHFNISVDEIDLICASLETSLGSVGGFCCGKAYVVDHQRLSGLGYCFSASQPPMLAVAATASLKTLQEKPELVDELAVNCKYMHKKLLMSKQFKVLGEQCSPIKHLILTESSGTRDQDKDVLRKIVDLAQEEKLALTVTSCLEHEELLTLPPSIRIAVNCELTKDEMDSGLQILDSVSKQVMVET